MSKSLPTFLALIMKRKPSEVIAHDDLTYLDFNTLFKIKKSDLIIRSDFIRGEYNELFK